MARLMDMTGYRAFLMGTATDLPCRGYSLKFQRRDDVESRRRAIGRVAAAGLNRAFGHDS